MKLATAIELYAMGTSQGALRGWDTRGRGRKTNLAPGQTTAQKHQDPETKMWTPSRVASHASVMEREIDGRTPAKWRRPVAVLMGGGTSSGKTSLGNRLFGSDLLHIDPDEMKRGIAEFERLKKEDPKNASARVHEESSYMTKLLLAEAVARDLDLRLDTTSSNPQSTQAVINFLSGRGYDIHAVFADVPVDVAKQRSEDRANDSSSPDFGRHVPEHVIEDSHRESARNFFNIKDNPALSSVRLYDNSGKAGDSKLVYSKEGGTETVHDADKFKTYKQKAGIQASAIRGYGSRPGNGQKRTGQND